MTDNVLDWTKGGAGLAYQRCERCRHVFYFRRDFCPACGNADAATLIPCASVGVGVVHASTLVYRAPTDDYKALAPYRVVLVDLEEGFRVMAHGDRDLVIGDAVVCRFHQAAGHLLPFFDKRDKGSTGSMGETGDQRTKHSPVS